MKKTSDFIGIFVGLLLTWSCQTMLQRDTLNKFFCRSFLRLGISIRSTCAGEFCSPGACVRGRINGAKMSG